MQPTPAARLAELTGARLIGDPSAVVGPDVIIDSRAVTPDCLFVAIAGENHDAHDFAPQAVAAGAGALLVQRELDVDVPQLVADDTVAALSALASGIVREARKAGLVSIGLTGSSGKTSTKDLLAQILDDAGQTVSPPGSLNNEIGVPLTCCRVDATTKYLVSELGARGIGHISWLTSITHPDIAMVLNVGVAHLGEFGGLDATAQAKGELVEAVDERGWAVLNADDPRVAAMVARTKGRVAWFAVDAEPDVDAPLVVTAADISLDALSRPAFNLIVRQGEEANSFPVALQLIGRHQAANAAAAAAAAIAAGVPCERVAQSLNQASTRSAWRMALTETGSGVFVLNDAYNANPDSMRAAIATLHQMIAAQRAARPGARAVAILGDMLELGPDSADLHRNVGASLHVDEIIAVGGFAADIVEGAAANGVAGRVLDKDDVAANLTLAPGDIVLLKASRGIGLETVAEQIVKGTGA